MKLMLALSVCSGLILHLTDSALMRKAEASDFLAILRKRHEDDGPCVTGRCNLEDNSDALDERDLRVRSSKRLESASSESAMMPQEIIFPPTPPDETTK
ncbi:Hypothetical predicted protein [Pelobates cultripes]|uniref:Uncharacterized protein n=1 Tax=Pelobates cultripes TaxID=61616 RepID=A0AAD1SWM2_PELCU|nr:Hypothetical predicted protein [Pelobates cultripes]